MFSNGENNQPVCAGSTFLFYLGVVMGVAKALRKALRNHFNISSVCVCICVCVLTCLYTPMSFCPFCFPGKGTVHCEYCEMSMYM